MRTLIKNGFVVDPKNSVYSKQNILIEDGKIKAYVGASCEADAIVDATEKIVSPGFVDIHMHEDPFTEDGDIDICIFNCMLRMGVTTAVGGNCGISVCSPSEYLDIVSQKGAPVNVATLVGYSYVRNRYGTTDRYASISDVQAEVIRNKISQELDNGCFGISYGVRYIPGVSTEELDLSAACCRCKDKMIAAHLRESGEGVLHAADEFTSIGQKYNISTEISHIGSMAGFGQMERFLRKIDKYRADGTDVFCDCYPYYAFSTYIGSATFDDGFLERYNIEYNALEVCEGTYKGQRCDEKMFKEIRANSPDALIVCHAMHPEDVDMALLHPATMIGSDGILNSGQGHPRAAGTFPRFMTEYVKKGKISLYDAINKMSTMPAKKLGMKNKGGLNVGADADITIFDLEKIKDNASFSSPLAAPDGIEYVFVGGKIALENGKIVNNRLGKDVRK